MTLPVNLNVPGTSQPPISDATQQSSESAHGQQAPLQSQYLHTASYANVTTITPVGTTPLDTVEEQTGRWTRFLCCVSSENAANPE